MFPLIVTLIGCGALRSEPAGYTGTIEVTQVEVAATVPGRIEAVYVDEGDRVEAGAPVFALDTSLLSLDAEFRASGVEMASAGVDAAKAQQRAAQAQVALLRRESDRVSRLEAAGVGTAQQASTLRGQLDVARAQSVAAEQGVAAASATVAQAEVGVAVARERLGEAEVASPVAGVVLTRNREPGEVLAPGISVATIGDLDHPRLRVYVPLTRVETLNLGGPVEVMLDAYDEPFKGKISRIASEAEFTPRDILTPDERVKRVFAVDVAIDPAPGLYPGIPAEARFGD